MRKLVVFSVLVTVLSVYASATYTYQNDDTEIDDEIESIIKALQLGVPNRRQDDGYDDAGNETIARALELDDASKRQDGDNDGTGDDDDDDDDDDGEEEAVLAQCYEHCSEECECDDGYEGCIELLDCQSGSDTRSLNGVEDVVNDIKAQEEREPQKKLFRIRFRRLRRIRFRRLVRFRRLLRFRRLRFRVRGGFRG